MHRPGCPGHRVDFELTYTAGCRRLSGTTVLLPAGLRSRESWAIGSTELRCSLPPAPYLKSSPTEGARRWDGASMNGVSAFTKETPERPSPHLPCDRVYGSERGHNQPLNLPMPWSQTPTSELRERTLLLTSRQV
jgi:hypothetical protein